MYKLLFLLFTCLSLGFSEASDCDGNFKQQSLPTISVHSTSQIKATSPPKALESIEKELWPNWLKPFNTDLYERISASKDWSESQIKKRYRQAAILLHPDKHETKSEELRGIYEEAFKAISEVGDILLSKEKRALYDRTGSKNNSFDRAGAAAATASTNKWQFSASTFEQFLRILRQEAAPGPYQEMFQRQMDGMKGNILILFYNLGYHQNTTVRDLLIKVAKGESHAYGIKDSLNLRLTAYTILSYGSHYEDFYQTLRYLYDRINFYEGVEKLALLKAQMRMINFRADIKPHLEKMMSEHSSLEEKSAILSLLLEDVSQRPEQEKLLIQFLKDNIDSSEAFASYANQLFLWAVHSSPEKEGIDLFQQLISENLRLYERNLRHYVFSNEYRDSFFELLSLNGKRMITPSADFFIKERILEDVSAGYIGRKFQGAKLDAVLDQLFYVMNNEEILDKLIYITRNNKTIYTEELRESVLNHVIEYLGATGLELPKSIEEKMDELVRIQVYDPNRKIADKALQFRFDRNRKKQNEIFSNFLKGKVN